MIVGCQRVFSTNQARWTVTLVLFGCWLIASSANAAGLSGSVPDSISRTSYYLLGVDAENAGPELTRLERSLGKSGGDRWFLTEYVRDYVNNNSEFNVSLNAAMDLWNPKEDRYNFSAVAVQDISVTTSSFEISGDFTYDTYVMVNLLWIYVGNDNGNHHSVRKIPELRFAVSRFAVRRFVNSAKPSSDALDNYVKSTFDSALQELFEDVSIRGLRDVKRRATDIRYVTVATPTIRENVKQLVLQNFEGGERLVNRMPHIVSESLEHELYKQLVSSDDMDDVIVLPNLEMLSTIRAQWPIFAQRIISASPYSAALSSIGIRSPKLLEVAPLCSMVTSKKNSPYDQVTGLELRSALLKIGLDSAALDPGVEAVYLSSLLAADIKLPLWEDGNKSVHVTKKKQKVISKKQPMDQKKPTAIPMQQWLGDELIVDLLGQNIRAIVPEVFSRLRQSIEDTPSLVSPSVRRKCQ